MFINKPFKDLLQVIFDLFGEEGTAGFETEFSSDNNLTSLSVKKWLAASQGEAEPALDQEHICVFAASYEGHDFSSVKSFIKDASAGSAPINRLCVPEGVGLRVLEMAPDLPYDISTPWSEEECMAAIAFGMEAVAVGGNLLGLSSCAPGGKQQSFSILKALDELTAEDNKLSEAFQVLQEKAGREIAASIGAIIAAKTRKLPVIVDDWSGLAAIAVLNAIHNKSIDHVLIAAAPDHEFESYALKLGKPPLIRAYMDIGPGAGNAAAISLLSAFCKA